LHSLQRMPKHLRIKSCYHVEFLDDDRALLVSEKDNALLSGNMYVSVLAELQQRSLSADDLVAALADTLSVFEVYYAIEVLEKKGYLADTAAAMPPAAAAYWESLGIDPAGLANVLQTRPIAVQCLGAVAEEPFLRAFASMGLKTGAQAALTVIVTDEYEHAALRQLNQEALDARQPWMLVKPTGSELWIGPIFAPGKTGCWACLQQRLALNRPLNALYRAHTRADNPPPIPAANLPATLRMAADLTAIEIVKWLYFGANERVEGQIVTFDTRALATRSHALVKRPQCPACGEPEQYRTTRPISLKRSASYCVTSMGGYRDVLPEDTLEAYQHHISPITGVVQTLQPYFSVKGAPVYNYTSGRNIALQSTTLFWLNTHLRNTNGGKGKTWSQAKAGALCEAIERYSGTYQGGEPFIISSLDRLGADGIHPNACMNFSARQYRDRDAANRACSKFYALVPAPFETSLAMPWTPVYSLTKQTFKYLPSCFCYAQYPADDEWNLFAYPDSNGGAAGNSLEEAILQGFLELVERDSVALWWYNMLRKPEVDLRSFQEPYFQQVSDYYAALHRRVYVLDLTADLRIPVFVAVSCRMDGGKDHLVFGCGAHVDAKIAVERALVELNQIFPIVQEAERDGTPGQYRTRDESFVNWLNTATLDNQPYFAPRDDVPKKTAADYPQLCAPTIYDSLMWCVNAAAERGLETLVLDLTRPDVGLPVAKVMVPGLRHFWKRLAPGRLYDVPVSLGWLQTPLTEEELNPMALFI
jgi:oxazoline/thiazoline synthase